MDRAHSSARSSILSAAGCARVQRHEARLPPAAPDPGSRGRRAAAGRIAVELGDAHRCRSRHGADDLRHGVWPDPHLRPDGRAELRPRRLHRRRRLRGGERHAGARPVDAGRLALAQPGGLPAGDPRRHGGERRAGPGLRARDRAAGLWPAPQADPRHHRRPDRGRAAPQGRVGTGADHPDPANRAARRAS